MHKELLYQSPLLALPLAALFVFLAVYLAVFVRTMLLRPREYDAVASIPLNAEDSHE